MYRTTDKKIFTEFKDYIISKNYFQASDELAEMRLLDKSILRKKGIFYSQSIIDICNRYPDLSKTSVPLTVGDLYTERYIYPICNTKGEVLLHMGYTPTPDAYQQKYSLSNLSGGNQRNIIANFESFSEYDGNLVFVCEGYFDALALESMYHKKSIALLGSYLSTPKKAILQRLKEDGYKLVYIPDLDEAGKSIASNKLWDMVCYYPKLADGKDFNDYLSICTYTNTNPINLLEVISKRFQFTNL